MRGVQYRVDDVLAELRGIRAEVKRIRQGLAPRDIMDVFRSDEAMRALGVQRPVAEQSPEPIVPPDPNLGGPLDQHTLAHVLTELADWESSRIRLEEGPELTTNDIHVQLKDSGYGDVVSNGILDQVIRAWQKGLAISSEDREDPRKPLDTITVGVSAHGDGWIKVEDVGPGPVDGELPGIGLGIGHAFTEGATIAVSPDEARQLATKLNYFAHQLAPDEVMSATEVYEAWSQLDVEHKREVLANMIEGFAELLDDMTIPEVGHDLINDALVISGDVRGR